jgi:hypothetical protein
MEPVSAHAPDGGLFLRRFLTLFDPLPLEALLLPIGLQLVPFSGDGRSSSRSTGCPRQLSSSTGGESMRGFRRGLVVGTRGGGGIDGGPLSVESLPPDRPRCARQPSRVSSITSTATAILLPAQRILFLFERTVLPPVWLPS